MWKFDTYFKWSYYIGCNSEGIHLVHGVCIVVLLKQLNSSILWSFSNPAIFFTVYIYVIPSWRLQWNYLHHIFREYILGNKGMLCKKNVTLYSLLLHVIHMTFHPPATNRPIIYPFAIFELYVNWYNLALKTTFHFLPFNIFTLDLSTYLRSLSRLFLPV